jgi:HPt (histidine-containing phosphotransfer) domain-containing protein
LLERVDNDMDFLAETVEMLVGDGRGLLAEVRTAVGAGDAAAVGRSAHALKGMISNFCAPEAQESALAIEKMGKSGDLAAAPAEIDTLARRLETLITDLQAFIRGGA